MLCFFSFLLFVLRKRHQSLHERQKNNKCLVRRRALATTQAGRRACAYLTAVSLVVSTLPPRETETEVDNVASGGGSIVRRMAFLFSGYFKYEDYVNDILSWGNENLRKTVERNRKKHKENTPVHN